MRMRVCVSLFTQLSLLAALGFAGITSAAAGELGWPKALLKTETWTVPPQVKAQEVESVIFGAPAVGYFALPRIEFASGKLRIEIFPPTYKSPVEYSLRLKNGRVLSLGRKSYASPFKKVFGEVLNRLEGRFSEPFFRTSWRPRDADRPLPVVINRLGEFVWAASLDGWPANSVMIEKATPATYALLSQGSGSAIKIVNAKSGESVREFSRPEILFHHAFAYDSQSEELIAFQHECRKLTYAQETLALFQGPSNWINYILLPRRTYAGSNLIKVNLHTGNVQKIWSTFDSFNPATTPNLALGFYRDKFRDIQTRRQYKHLAKQSAFDDSFGFSCNADWSHENSVRHYTGQGYLVSQRNLNRVLMIGDGGELKWTMGNENGDTFAIRNPGQFMGHQHDAHLLDDGRLLVFDNQTRYRGYPEGVRPNAIKIFLLKEGEAFLDWSFDLPGPAAEFRGSAEPIKNGRLFVYQSPGEAHPSRLMEIRIADKSVHAIMELNASGERRSVEARPQGSIADEIYLRPDTESARPVDLSKLKLPAAEKSEFASEGY